MKISIKNSTLSTLLLLMISSMTTVKVIAKNPSPLEATLSFSDGRTAQVDLTEINATLHTIGVNLSNVNLPQEAIKILKHSSQSKLNEKQQAEILKIFSLSRKEILTQIQLAGRKPVMARGGNLSTQEVGVPAYPKIYDMKAMSSQDHIDAQHKFGKLHVNYTENGQGVDEVMTIIAGGPWTWFFTLKDNVIVKLSLSRIPLNGPGWRLSYAGKVPHGAFMNAKDGICVAYITGPKTWQMRYEAPALENAKVLGTNPWIDFSNTQPILLDHIQK